MTRRRWLAFGLVLVAVGSCLALLLIRPGRSGPVVLGILGAPPSVWIRVDGPERFQVDSQVFASPGGPSVGRDWVCFACDRSPTTEFVLFLIHNPDPESKQSLFDRVVGLPAPNLLDGSETGYARTSTCQVVDGATWVEFQRTSHDEAVSRMMAWPNRHGALR